MTLTVTTLRPPLVTEDTLNRPELDPLLSWNVALGLSMFVTVHVQLSVAFVTMVLKYNVNVARGAGTSATLAVRVANWPFLV